MKYFLIEFYNGYASCVRHFITEASDDANLDDIDATYSHTFDCYCDYYSDHDENWTGDGWDSDEDEEDYYDNCCWWIEEIDNEEYNGYVLDGFPHINRAIEKYCGHENCEQTKI